MLPALALPALAIRCIRFENDVVLLEAEGIAPRASCPSCGALTFSLHGHYRRRPLDLPWRGGVVRLIINVRRFDCPNLRCPRATFAEDFGPELYRFSRRTATADQLLLTIAFALGGEAGARLASASGLPTSADTLLRMLRAVNAPQMASPRVLGVDGPGVAQRDSLRHAAGGPGNAPAS